MTSYLLWTLCGLVLLTAQTYATFVETEGEGGEQCGKRRCLINKAFCDSNSCLCRNPPFAYGDGSISCYKNNTFRTEITNDPDVLTFNDNRMSLPLPCRYLLSSSVNFLKDKQRKKAGNCTVETYVFHQKHRGKVYVAGFDFAIKIHHDNGSVKNMSFRMHGLADNGLYNFHCNATDDEFNPQGPWHDSDINYIDPNTGLKIRFEYMDDENLVILNAKKCGVKVQFRPYDGGLRRHQPYLPHISYNINCAFHPVFVDNRKVVSLPPEEHLPGLNINTVPPFHLTPKQKLFLRALNSGATQNSPEPNLQCDYVRDQMNACSDSDQIKAFDNCMFFLESPRFIRCYDDTPSGAKITELFGKCVDVQCHFASCPGLVSHIISSMCHVKAPYQSVTNFINNSCNPNTPLPA